MLPLRYPIGNLLARRARTALTALVVALVVMVVVLFAGVVSSLKHALVATGNPRNLVVLHKGATNDGSSALTLDAYQALRFFDGVQHDADGTPLASPELVVQPFFYTHAGLRETVLVRGVEPAAFRVHDEVRVSEGRNFEPGSREAIVGRQVAGRYKGATLGSDLAFGRDTWKVVGIFDSDGSSLESEVWVNAAALAADARRRMPYSGIRLRLAEGADPDALIRRIEGDTRWVLEASRETAYYQKQADAANAFYWIAVGLAVLAGIGASFGAANAFYGAVQSRRAEIGTLRALGFSRTSILTSFLVEAVVVAVCGFAIGAVVAAVASRVMSWLLGGIAFGAQTNSTNVVEFRVGAQDCAMGLALALVIGLVGGLAPAARAARLQPTEALRKA